MFSHMTNHTYDLFRFSTLNHSVIRYLAHVGATETQSYQSLVLSFEKK